MSPYSGKHSHNTKYNISQRECSYGGYIIDVFSKLERGKYYLAKELYEVYLPIAKPSINDSQKDNYSPIRQCISKWNKAYRQRFSEDTVIDCPTCQQTSPHRVCSIGESGKLNAKKNVRYGIDPTMFDMVFGQQQQQAQSSTEENEPSPSPSSSTNVTKRKCSGDEPLQLQVKRARTHQIQIDRNDSTTAAAVTPITDMLFHEDTLGQTNSNHPTDAWLTESPNIADDFPMSAFEEISQNDAATFQQSNLFTPLEEHDDSFAKLFAPLEEEDPFAKFFNGIDSFFDNIIPSHLSLSSLLEAPIETTLAQPSQPSQPTLPSQLALPTLPSQLALPNLQSQQPQPQIPQDYPLSNNWLNMTATTCVDPFTTGPVLGSMKPDWPTFIALQTWYLTTQPLFSNLFQQQLMPLTASVPVAQQTQLVPQTTATDVPVTSLFSWLTNENLSTPLQQHQPSTSSHEPTK